MILIAWAPHQLIKNHVYSLNNLVIKELESNGGADEKVTIVIDVSY